MILGNSILTFDLFLEAQSSDIYFVVDVQAVSIFLQSYMGKATLVVMAAEAIVPDPEVLCDIVSLPFSKCRNRPAWQSSLGWIKWIIIKNPTERCEFKFLKIDLIQLNFQDF